MLNSPTLGRMKRKTKGKRAEAFKPTSCLQAPLKVRLMIPRLYKSEYARKAEIAIPKLNKWLNGKGGMRYDQLWRLARALGLSMDYLCDDEQPAPRVDSPAFEEGHLVRTRIKKDLR